MDNIAREELKTINARIKREKRRLIEIFKKVDEKSRKSAEKLIDRAAFMLISLEDMEEKIKKDGQITTMQQGDYEIKRAHPLYTPYLSMAKIYVSVCGQLRSYLPPGELENEEARAVNAFACEGKRK